jgi:hypothetical protein
VSAAERRIEKIRAYVEQSLALLPDEKDENDDALDEVNDAIRGTLLDIKVQLTGPLGRTFAEIQVTGDGMRTVGIYRLFFKAALRAVRKRQDDYDAEVAAWHEEHPGYAFPTCIHGSSRWTDYDNICGWCEEGSTVVDLARLEARTNFLRFVEHYEFMLRVPNTVSEETRRAISDTLVDLFPKF